MSQAATHGTGRRPVAGTDEGDLQPTARQPERPADAAPGETEHRAGGPRGDGGRCVQTDPFVADLSFHPPEAAVHKRRRSEALRDHVSWFMVGRNGMDLAVEALARVRRTIPSAELKIYGSRTAFLDRVTERARSKGLGDCARYLGPKRLEVLVRAIAHCDIGAIPNHRNELTEINRPTRVFEYLSSGKPKIAPRTPGIEDHFGPKSLFFFESGNADEYVYPHPLQAVETAEGRAASVQGAHVVQEGQALVGLVGGLLDKEQVS